MFNYFLKQKTEKLQKDQKASITYLIDLENVPMIDVLLDNYDDDSMQALCSLLDILSKDSFYIETVKMISDTLVTNGRQDLLIKIFKHIDSKENSKITNALHEDIESQVCISPLETGI